MEIEHFFTCPYCWQEISMILDLSVGEQNYIEDCEVCCRPVQIFYAAEDFELIDFAAASIEQ
jgi:transcription elongation factor Elf1